VPTVSNMRSYVKTKSNKEYAEIDEKFFLWFKRRRRVFKQPGAHYWFYCDTGERAPEEVAVLKDACEVEQEVAVERLLKLNGQEEQA
jgi:hypothetical protein